MNFDSKGLREKQTLVDIDFVFKILRAAQHLNCLRSAIVLISRPTNRVNLAEKCAALGRGPKLVRNKSEHNTISEREWTVTLTKHVWEEHQLGCSTRTQGLAKVAPKWYYDPPLLIRRPIVPGGYTFFIQLIVIVWILTWERGIYFYLLECYNNALATVYSALMGWVSYWVDCSVVILFSMQGVFYPHQNNYFFFRNFSTFCFFNSCSATTKIYWNSKWNIHQHLNVIRPRIIPLRAPLNQCGS